MIKTTTDAQASAAEHYLNEFPTVSAALQALAEALHELTGDLAAATLLDDAAAAQAKHEATAPQAISQCDATLQCDYHATGGPEAIRCGADAFIGHGSRAR
jgi:hypothetical protein